MKKFAILLSILLVLGVLAACGGKETATETSTSNEGEEAQLNQEKIKVGATSGPQEQILEVAAKVAAEDGLEIEVVSFSDYIMPNTALDEGELDANSYQHKPFLDTFNEDHGTNLVPVGKTILNPMGIYSTEYDSMEDLPKGSKFGLPSDPTNGSRALAILADAGYIKIKEGKENDATVYDVEENKYELEFIELDAAQIPKQLPELAAAAINTNFALEAGLSPKEDSILLESTDSPYVNYIVAREENKDDPVIQKLVKAYQSEEVKQYILEEFKGSMIPSWDEE